MRKTSNRNTEVHRDGPRGRRVVGCQVACFFGETKHIGVKIETTTWRVCTIIYIYIYLHSVIMYVYTMYTYKWYIHIEMLPLTVTMGMKVDMGSFNKNKSLLVTSVFCCRKLLPSQEMLSICGEFYRLPYTKMAMDIQIFPKGNTSSFMLDFPLHLPGYNHGK